MSCRRRWRKMMSDATPPAVIDPCDGSPTCPWSLHPQPPSLPWFFSHHFAPSVKTSSGRRIPALAQARRPSAAYCAFELSPLGGPDTRLAILIEATVPVPPSFGGPLGSVSGYLISLP